MDILPKPKTVGTAGAPRPRVQVARAEPRVRTHLRTGRILDLQRNVLAECLILDVSPHGARLRLQTQMIKPPKLLLVFDERSQSCCEAEVRWHRDNEIGVFIKGGTLSLVSR